MKATELRVGNLIAYFSGDRWRVKKVTSRDIAELEAHPHNPHYRGIPVTPARLKKLGFFERSPGVWQRKGFYGFELKRVSHGSELFQAVKFIDDKKHFVVNMGVAFVHELQNMFYVREGRELRSI